MWQWNPDPFGNGAPSGAFSYELRFPGQFFDQATKLHYNYFRDYDPRLGRYIESDPIGLRGGINTYAYVGDNPVANYDNFGLVNQNYFPAAGWPYLGNLADWANGYNEPGVYTVAGHGNESAFGNNIPFDPNSHLSPQDLANKILNDPDYTPGEPVRIIACNTGRTDPKTGTSFAQQLSELLGAPVYAPTGPFQVTPSGDNLVPSVQNPQGPPWLEFVPVGPPAPGPNLSSGPTASPASAPSK